MAVLIPAGRPVQTHLAQQCWGCGLRKYVNTKYSTHYMLCNTPVLLVQHIWGSWTQTHQFIFVHVFFIMMFICTVCFNICVECKCKCSNIMFCYGVEQDWEKKRYTVTDPFNNMPDHVFLVGQQKKSGLLINLYTIKMTQMGVRLVQIISR